LLLKVKQSRYTPWRSLGARSYSSYSFTTSALDGVSGQFHSPAALLAPGKGPPEPFVQEAGWAPEPVWTQRIEEKSFAPAGDRTPIAQPNNNNNNNNNNKKSSGKKQKSLTDCS
jgi:hypothetical protein